MFYRRCLIELAVDLEFHRLHVIEVGGEEPRLGLCPTVDTAIEHAPFGLSNRFHSFVRRRILVGDNVLF